MMLRRALFRAPSMMARGGYRLRSTNTTNEFAIHEKDAKQQEISEEFSGIPQEVLAQIAIIGKPPPTSTQQIDYLNYWEIRFPEGKQWKDSLMGWTKSNQPTRWSRELLRFPTREAAVAFCERNAFNYQVENERPVIYNSKSYGDKFKFRGAKKPDTSANEIV